MDGDFFTVGPSRSLVVMQIAGFFDVRFASLTGVPSYRVMKRWSVLIIEAGTRVLEAAQDILTIGEGEMTSSLDEGTEDREISDTFNDNLGRTELSVAWTPFSTVQERLHFSDKGAARISRASIL